MVAVASTYECFGECGEYKTRANSTVGIIPSLWRLPRVGTP